MKKERLQLLIVEDDAASITAFELLLKPKYLVTFAKNCREALEAWEENPFDIILLDFNLPDGTGHDLLKRIREDNPKQDIIMTSAESEPQTIVESIKLGASDYVTKPIQKDRLLAALEKIAKQKQLEWERKVLLQKVQDSEERCHGIVGDSFAIRHICETISKLKGTETSVLLIGESGVGKEIIARAIHRQEKDPIRPFVAVNCAAIPENLLESELFGHEKGAFTGATQTRIGKFAQAHGGDIFLDEIACMSPALQAKLLRILQDKIIEPLGSTKQTKSNFRVIAATNHDLKGAIEKGTFRQDLYFRLQGMEIYIPPLRARSEDVFLLMEHILKELSPKFGRRHFSEEAMQILMQYEWPGNVRELKNTIENILILHRDELIEARHLPPNLKNDSERNGENLWTHLRSNMKNYERDVIIAALKRYRGNKSRASKELGISRSILYRKMKMLDLTDQDLF